jgi:hypothetical protein
MALRAYKYKSQAEFVYKLYTQYRNLNIIRPKRINTCWSCPPLIFCSISIFLLASLVTGRIPQCNCGAEQQGMYSIRPIHWKIKPSPASPGRSRVGPVLYVTLGCWPCQPFEILFNNYFPAGKPSVR